MASSIVNLVEKLYVAVTEFTPDYDACEVDLPSCVVVSHCEPAVDCCDPGLVAIYVNTVQPQVSALNAQKCLTAPREIELVVELWGCVNVEIMQDFSEQGMTLESLGLLDQMWTLLSVVKKELGDEECTPPTDYIVNCISPQGGCAGWRLSFTLPI